MQNIVNSLGAGSGIDTLALVDQLVELEKAPSQQRIDSKRERLETQVSDLGLLRSALSTLQDAAKLVSSSETFNTKSASFTENDALVPTTLDSDAPTGNYSFEVLSIAQAQSFSSTTFSDPSDAVGKGTLTFRFGEWDAGLSAFTVDSSKNSKTITIDDSNNSLTGLANEINNADMGVQASIIEDSGSYRLLITAPSGATNELEISVSEDGGSPTNTDANDLSRFAFNTSAQQITQNQAGADAQLKVNGLTLNRSSNDVTDVIEGFEFSLSKAAPGEVINVSISDDKSAGEQVIRDFVEAYNTFLEALEPVMGYNDETETYGSLHNDSLSESIPAQIRSLIANAIPGLSKDFTNLANVGVVSKLDGTLTIDEDAFSTALSDHYDLVKAVFSQNVESTSDKIVINGVSDMTVAGEYDISITSDAAKGYLTGSAISETFPLDTTGKSYSFTVNVDGTESALLTIPTGTYNTSADLATAMESLINGDSTLQAAGVGVEVTFDTDHFVITSDTFGTKSSVSITAADTQLATDLGIDTTSVSTSGKDVVGTVNGVAGFGFGNILLPALNTDPTGLSMTVKPGATTSTVNFSRGFGDELVRLIDNFMDSTGVFDTREESIQKDLNILDDDQESLDRRIEAYQERLTAQFIAMENIVRSLNSSASFLDSTLSNLLDSGSGK